MSRNYSIDISTRSTIDTIEFELLKASSSEYWHYTATRYSGPDTAPLEYLVVESPDYPVGQVSTVLNEDGVVWEYTDYPIGALHGTAKTFKEALRKLTKNAFAND